jgi:hypothetical protein
MENSPQYAATPSAEVVQLLNIPPKWLKELVRRRRVPHQRTGETKGVWFTAADVVEKAACCRSSCPTAG